VLGLPAGTGLTDDDVRAAWRRIATATHPDRADGGDPARFAEAAAAYTVPRTRFGRGEALADLSGTMRTRSPARFRGRLPRSASPAGHGAQPGPPGPPGSPSEYRPRSRTAAWRPLAPAFLPNGAWLAAHRLWSRTRRGRPLRLTLRVCVAAAASAASAVAVGAHPATPAIIVGALTWLSLTAHHDLAP
jgi:curved DNA-binding protein CbpA